MKRRSRGGDGGGGGGREERKAGEASQGKGRECSGLEQGNVTPKKERIRMRFHNFLIVEPHVEF